MPQTLQFQKLDNYCWWRCALGKHPFPSRTRWLRPKRPMVLHWRRCGRAGGCQRPNKKHGKVLIKIERAPTEACQPDTAGKRCWYNWFDQWSEVKKEVLRFWWLMKPARKEDVPWKPHIQTSRSNVRDRKKTSEASHTRVWDVIKPRKFERTSGSEMNRMLREHKSLSLTL